MMMIVEARVENARRLFSFLIKIVAIATYVNPCVFRDRIMDRMAVGGEPSSQCTYNVNKLGHILTFQVCYIT